MSSSKPNAKKTKSSILPSLKQGTLAFPTAKRTGSSATVSAKAKKPITRTKSAPSTVQVQTSDSGPSSDSISEIEERIEKSSSDEYVDPPAVVSSKQKKATKLADKGKAPLRPKEENTKTGALDLRANNPGKWAKYYVEVRDKMGNLEPIHAEEQNKVNEILRVFDTSSEYGPCVGVTRLERWQRAETLGLNPPVEVHEILTTPQGIEEEEFKYSVFYGMV